MCSGGRQCHQWETHSARGSGRRWSHGDSSAPCQHSRRPVGARRARHSSGHARPRPQCSRVPTSHTWGMGQHPQAPLLVTQHVASSGHSDWPSGQGTARGAAETGETSPRPFCPSRPTPAPYQCPLVPRSVTQDSPSALQRDPRGQQWWPPAQGTLWRERRGWKGRGSGSAPQMAGRGGKVRNRGGGSPLAAGSWRDRMSCPGTPLHCGQERPGVVQGGVIISC